MSPPPAFGTYRVLHQIGSGVLGPVFRGYDSERDRLVAIKTFKLDLVPEDAARLADRLRAIAAEPPAHAAIVGGVDAGLAGATPFIALEYASGESLDVLLRQGGAWPIARALPVLRELAAAIDAAWTRQAGHGALHPRDIFVDAGSSDVRVSGFGIGQALEGIGLKPSVRRPYAAPERGEGAPWDIHADVYSLGVVAFEVLSGRRPVESDEDAGLVSTDLPPGARAAVERVLAVAMSDQPAGRYNTATEFVQALTEAAASEPVTAPLAVVKRAARIKRPRPVALNLPLLDEAAEPETQPESPATDVATSVGQGPEPDPPFAPALEAGASAFDEPTPVSTSLPERPVRAWPVESHAPVRPVPGRDFGHALIREIPDAVEEPDGSGARFPWAAIAAVFLAGLVLGGVVMYQWGWSRGGAAVRQAAAAAIPASSVVQVGAPVVADASAADVTASEPVMTAVTPTPSRSPAPAAGRLVIQSVPAGALVTIDGHKAGETPVSVAVSLGRHDVQVARPGYVPFTERVELTTKAASRTLRVQLKRGSGGPRPDRQR